MTPSTSTQAAAIAEAPGRPLRRAGSRSAPPSSSTGRSSPSATTSGVQEGSAIKHGETDCTRERPGACPHRVYARATMVTTLSPCDMCNVGRSWLYKIPRVVVGENPTFQGGEDLLRSHGVEVVVLDDAECVAMMTEFIATNP